MSRMFLPYTRACYSWKPGLNGTFARRSHRGQGKIRPNQKCASTIKLEETAPRSKETTDEEIIRNPANIQMISDAMFSQVFIDRFRERGCEEKTFEKCKSHLKAHSLWGKSKVEPSPPVNFQIPTLEGISIDDHFRNIALQQSFKYKALLDEIMVESLPPLPKNWALQIGWVKYLEDGCPQSVPFPEENAYVFDIEVCLANGHVPTLACAVSSKAWYTWCSPHVVNGIERNPLDPVTLSELIPFETSSDDANDVKWTEKLIVGHNVSYDRARIKEQYLLEETKLRFVDTMSTHIAISGITSFQRALKMAMSKGLKAMSGDKRGELMRAGALEWNDISSLNNLADVYKLYCDGDLQKETRKIFVTGNIHEIKDDFQNLMTYCANDVRATHGILMNIMPIFFERFPHPVTFAGMLEMGMTYLPINTNWSRYIKTSEETYDSLEREVKAILIKKADEALELLDGEKYKKDPWMWDQDWKITKVRRKASTTNTPNSPVPNVTSYPAWYRNLFLKESDPDYQPGPARLSTSMRVVPKLLRLCWFGFPLHHSKKGGWGFLIKKAPIEEEIVEKNEEDPPTSQEELNSKEKSEKEEDSKFPFKEWEEIWERSKIRLSERIKAQVTMASNVRILGSELKMKPEDAVQDLQDFLKGLESLTDIGLRKEKTPKSAKVKAIIQNSYANSNSPHPNCEFHPLPHKDGTEFRVGNPLAKDFLNKIEDGILTCENGEDIANHVVRLSKMVSYWRNNRDRIMGQVTVWLKNSELPKCLGSELGSKSDFEYGAILPQVSVSGTLTRRAVEKTWMTASNAYVDRVGSELKGIIQAPQNYHFVGADVDSQELWIASVIGDAYFAGMHGSTALGWMTLQGTKGEGTDMHSKTASLIGIERDQAKILNYGRIYGAGVTFAERLLRQFNHDMSVTDAKDKARKMYKRTKGERKFLLNETGRGLAESSSRYTVKKSEPFSKTELRSLLQETGYPYMNMMDFVEKMVWDEGTESQMFNRLEEIAQAECPQTPILNCSISRSLVPSAVQNDFMTSRVNWVVQSSAVDYLHLMLVSMRWLFQKYGISGRFSLSVHDEVRYLVKSEDRYKAALALQITNLLTRAMCSHQLGMFDLPQSVAFFSCVDIDKVLRKEVTQDCVTPSNPNGLSKGYNIPEGEALDIFQLLEITKGSLK